MEEFVSPILSEYDDLLNAMQRQIDLYKTEHDLLRTEIVKLLTQNQDLYKLVDDEFHRKLEKDFSIEINPVINSEMVRNLRRQLELSLLERKQLNELFQTSQNEIAHLRKGKTEPVRTAHGLESKFEDLCLELKMEKSVREDEESLRIRAQTDAAKLRVLLQDKCDNFDELDRRKLDVEQKYRVLEQESTVLRATLECVRQSRDDLEVALSQAEERIIQLQGLCDEAKAKVEEAVEVAERAVSDRDMAVKREIQLQGEVSRLEQYIPLATDEATKKFNAKMEEMESGFNNKLLKTQQDLQEKEQLLVIKNLETEKTGIFQQLELALADKKNLQDKVTELTQEIIQVQSGYTTNQRQLKDTKNALRNVLNENDKLIEELQAVAARENQISELEKKLHNLERIAEKLKTIKTEKSKKINDLQTQLARQVALNEKWEKESGNLVRLLEESAKKSFKQTEKLRIRNKQLTLMLKEAKISHVHNHPS